MDLIKMSKVYFIPENANENVLLIEKLGALLERVGVGNLNGVVALKMHMGERKNKTFLKPVYVRR
jgi:uncharacterized Fe-S center protein